MADELKQTLSLETKLIEGGKGIFEIKVDGKLIFSKKEVGRFPEEGEITKMLGGQAD